MPEIDVAQRRDREGVEGLLVNPVLSLEQQERVWEIIKAGGLCRSGHFDLKLGQHSAVLLNPLTPFAFHNALSQIDYLADLLCFQLINLLREKRIGLDTILIPDDDKSLWLAMGINGAISRSIDKQPGWLNWLRGLKMVNIVHAEIKESQLTGGIVNPKDLYPDDCVLFVSQMVTNEQLPFLKKLASKQGVFPVAMACFAHAETGLLKGVKTKKSLPVLSLVTFPAWPKAECPLCQEGIPLSNS